MYELVTFSFLLFTFSLFFFLITINRRLRESNLGPLTKKEKIYITRPNGRELLFSFSLRNVIRIKLFVKKKRDRKYLLTAPHL